MLSEQYFGGCEGGGSNSIAVIVDSIGNILGEASGGGTNQWLIGRICNLFGEHSLDEYIGTV